MWSSLGLIVASFEGRFRRLPQEVVDSAEIGAEIGTMAIDLENLGALFSSQLSHLTFILSLIINRCLISFRTMYSSLNLTLFQPSYLRSWHRVEDSKIYISSILMLNQMSPLEICSILN